MIDVVAGYDDVTGYEKGEASIGATLGRVANRIGGASFDIEGKTYLLTANDGKNTLHGGRDFYPKRLWKTVEADESHVTFELLSSRRRSGIPWQLYRVSDLYLDRGKWCEDSLPWSLRSGYFGEYD